MNELENQLAALISKAIAAAEQTGQFVIDEAPELIEQFLLWKGVYNGLSTLMIFIPIVLWRAFRKLGKDVCEDEYDYDNVEILAKHYNHNFVFLFLILAIPTALFVVGTSVHSFLKLLQIIITPKIYLIEYFSNLI